jgi:hypothetical protein
LGESVPGIIDAFHALQPLPQAEALTAAQSFDLAVADSNAVVSALAFLLDRSYGFLGLLSVCKG